MSCWCFLCESGAARATGAAALAVPDLDINSSTAPFPVTPSLFCSFLDSRLLPFPIAHINVRLASGQLV